MGALLRSCSGQSPDPSPGISGPQDRLCPGSVIRRRPAAAVSFFTSLRRTPILPVAAMTAKTAGFRVKPDGWHRASGERRSEVKGESRAQTGSADMSEVARRLLCRRAAASNNTAGFCSTRFGVGKMGALLRSCHPPSACGRRLLLYFTTQNTHPASCSDDRDDGRVSGQTRWLAQSKR